MSATDSLARAALRRDGSPATVWGSSYSRPGHTPNTARRFFRWFPSPASDRPRTTEWTRQGTLRWIRWWVLHRRRSPGGCAPAMTPGFNWEHASAQATDAVRASATEPFIPFYASCLQPGHVHRSAPTAEQHYICAHCHRRWARLPSAS